MVDRETSPRHRESPAVQLHTTSTPAIGQRHLARHRKGTDNREWPRLWSKPRRIVRLVLLIDGKVVANLSRVCVWAWAFMRVAFGGLLTFSLGSLRMGFQLDWKST